jgi:electron transfer flavoprotein beta subunit
MTGPAGGPVIAVCLRHTGARPAVDALTGAVRPAGHGAGPAPAELAALELGLRFAAAWGGRVLAVTAGPPAAGATLRDALAAGAGAALRVDWPEPDDQGYLDGLAADEQPLAAALASALRPHQPVLVLCGDRSADRGTGALPAFLAHELGAAQALGLVWLDTAGEADSGLAGQTWLAGDRRLPGGWRERLRIGLPAVCSVEAAGVGLRRASLDAVIASRRAVIPVVRPAVATAGARAVVISGPPRPYRPRTREVPPPPAGSARERLAELSGVLVQRDPPVLLGPAAPEEAAGALLDFLRRTGDGESPATGREAT